MGKTTTSGRKEVSESLPERIDSILAYLEFNGVDCYSSWLGRGDGPYIVARNKLWVKSDPNKAMQFLVPLDEKTDNSFKEFILQQL